MQASAQAGRSRIVRGRLVDANRSRVLYLDTWVGEHLLSFHGKQSEALAMALAYVLI
jgi:hypothetical protein